MDSEVWHDDADHVILEDIPNAIAINIDIRVEPPLAITDEMSLAPFQTQPHPVPPAATGNTHAVQVEDAVPDPDESSSTDGSESEDDDDPMLEQDANEDWHFVHLCLVGKRIFHGRLPWNQPHILMQATSDLTVIPADDIVHLHYVGHGPEDLRAAHVSPLIGQVYDDLCIVLYWLTLSSMSIGPPMKFLLHVGA